MAKQSAAPMTLDAIERTISALASDPESKDQLRALKILAGMRSGGGVAGIPPPLSDDEVVERLARLLKGSGEKLGALAYVQAYKADPPPLPEPPPTTPRPAVATPGAALESTVEPEVEAPSPHTVTPARKGGLRSLLRA
jgi:hypothetical protein